MSLKLIVVCAMLAAVSCGKIDNNEQLNRQVQQEMVQQQNEQIRDLHRVENQQRQAQIHDLEDQRRRQEQIVRNHEQQRRENIRNIFFAPQPNFLPASYQFITIPASNRHFDYLDNSNFNFAYAVSDLTTGDVKSQNEVRRGDQVQGQYTMMDADGYQRVVEYRADNENGFDAEVRREPAVVAPQIVRNDGTNKYAPNFFHQRQHAQFIPTIYATTSVSRQEDGQQNHYTSTTSSNF